MSEQAEELANRYDLAVETLVKAVGDLPQEVWTTICLDLGWTVAATTRHIADFMTTDPEWIEQAARGEQTAVQSIDALHRNNAERALAHAYADHDETLALIELAHQRGRTLIAGLSGDQLALRISMDMVFPSDVSSDPWVAGIIAMTGASARLDDMVEYVLIGHVERHLQSIVTAVSEAGRTSGGAETIEGNTA